MTADVFAEAPQGYPTQRATPVATVDIIVPASIEYELAAVIISINRYQVRDVGAEAKELQIERLTGNQYQPLSMDVVSAGSKQVTLRVETPGFFIFVVSVPAATTLTVIPKTSTPTPIATPEPPMPTTTATATSMSTPLGIPEFGSLVAIGAVITLAIIIRFRFCSQRER